MLVKFIDSMGTDLSVVNAARVSFGKESSLVCKEGLDCCQQPVGCYGTLSKPDQGLIQFLARGCTSGDWDKALSELEDAALGDLIDPDIDTSIRVSEILNRIRLMPPHWTPFAHTAITLHMKVPIFVARQIHKHQVGFVVNEVSRRYITDEPEFFSPTWRWAATNVKQGSGQALTQEQHHKLPSDNEFVRASNACINTYYNLISDGICPEQARMVLPQSMYTEFYMTGNLFGWVNLFNQRSDSHAQRETQEVAKQIGSIIEPLFPYSWKALTK